MDVLSWNEAIAGPPVPSAATIGVFDGLHIGHMALVAKVCAQAPGLRPLAVTFRENPKRLTAPHRPTGALFSLEQKLSTLESAGVAAAVLIDFSGNFSKLAGKDFISLLVRSCGVRSFVVGSDFKCGHRLSTDSAALAEIALSLGASTEVVQPVLFGGEAVSSSRIRAAIADGRMDLALAMLGRPYALDLRGLDMESAGGKEGFSPHGKGLVMPKPGDYEARLDGWPITASVLKGGRVEWAGQGRKAPAFLEFGPFDGPRAGVATPHHHGYTE